MADIELTKALHERVYERIRDSIGDLMTDEDLKVLVDKAAEKAFFENRTIPATSGYGSATFKEPVIVEEVRNLLASKVSTAVKEWVAEHPDEIAKIIQDSLAAGMFGLVEQHFKNIARNQFMMLQTELQSAIQRGY